MIQEWTDKPTIFIQYRFRDSFDDSCTIPCVVILYTRVLYVLFTNVYSKVQRETTSSIRYG